MAIDTDTLANSYISLGLVFRGGLTWDNLDIRSGVHRHHLGVDTDAISPERIQTVWDLYQRQSRVAIRVEILLDGVGAMVNVEIT